MGRAAGDSVATGEIYYVLFSAHSQHIHTSIHNTILRRSAFLPLSIWSIIYYAAAAAASLLLLPTAMPPSFVAVVDIIIGSYYRTLNNPSARAAVQCFLCLHGRSSCPKTCTSPIIIPRHNQLYVYIRSQPTGPNRSSSISV